MRGFPHQLRVLGAVSILVCGALLPACGPRAVQATPDAVVSAYAEALLAGRIKEAYALMSQEFRRTHTLDAFEQLLKRDQKELALSLGHLRRDAGRLTVEAVVRYGNGDTLKLRSEGGVWRITTDPTDVYSQRTPAEALRSFVKALERKRYDIILRFAPTRWARELSADTLRRQWEGDRKGEAEVLLEALKAQLDMPIHTEGDRATLSYGENSQLRMIREDGLWKIEDPD